MKFNHFYNAKKANHGDPRVNKNDLHMDLPFIYNYVIPYMSMLVRPDKLSAHAFIRFKHIYFKLNENVLTSPLSFDSM